MRMSKGIIGNTEPIDLRDMAKESGQSIEVCLAFFDKNFGGYANYVRACDNNPEVIVELFDRWEAEKN